jgi:hypothetical protein
MALQDIVNLSITLKSSSPTKAGFGRPLLLSYGATFTGRTKLYKNADDLVADGMPTTSQEYKQATALKSQSPCVKDFKIGKCLLKPTQIIDLTPTSTVEGFVYSGKINGSEWTYTVGAAATLAGVCTGIAAAITALAGVTATGASGTKVVVTTDTAGQICQYTEMVPELRVKDATVDPGIATDLAAIYAADSDWFALAPNSQSEAEIGAIAAWIETKRRMCFFATADYGATDSGTTTDVLSDLKALEYFNTGGAYHHEIGSVLPAAALGSMLTKTPGSYTWAHKSFVGVTKTGAHANGSLYLSTAQEAAVLAKNGSVYTEIAGNGNFFEGKVASGEFFDQTRYIHFQFARVQEAVIGLFQGNDKIEYTDAGVDKVRGAIESVLTAHTKKPYNALVPGSVLVEAPKVADVDAADKNARRLPDVTYSCTLTGAIHATDVSGTVSTT